MEYGTVNYNSSGSGDGSVSAKDIKIHSGKERFDKAAYVTVFRIAPPILSGRDTGRIVTYEPKHWGYYGVNRRDPTKPTARTFICTRERDFRENVITQECAECLLIEQHEREISAMIREILSLQDDGKKFKYRDFYAVAVGKATPGAKQRLSILYKFLVGDDGIGSHSIDSKPWKLNAWSETDQTAGFLRLSGYNWRQIKARKGDEGDPAKHGLIDKYLAMGIDPIAPDQGLFFQLTRIGNGSGIGAPKDKIEVVDEPIDPARPMMGRRPKMAPITQKMDEAFGRCLDLNNCSPSVRLSAGQVEQLVALYQDGKNSPEAVDEIFNAGRRPAAGPARSSFRQDLAPADEGEEVPEFQPPTPTLAPPAPAQPSAQQAAPSRAEPAPATTLPAISGLSQEERDMLDMMRSRKRQQGAK